MNEFIASGENLNSSSSTKNLLGEVQPVQGGTFGTWLVS